MKSAGISGSWETRRLAHHSVFCSLRMRFIRAGNPGQWHMSSFNRNALNSTIVTAHCTSEPIVASLIQLKSVGVQSDEL
jgi:hypothetical protein